MEQGFRTALADDSYTALFDRFHAETMALAGISERSVLHFPMAPESPPSR